MKLEDFQVRTPNSAWPGARFVDFEGYVSQRSVAMRCMAPEYVAESRERVKAELFQHLHRLGCIPLQVAPDCPPTSNDDTTCEIVGNVRYIQTYVAPSVKMAMGGYWLIQADVFARQPPIRPRLTEVLP